MGNSNAGDSALTHHWQHVSPTLIRHSLTHELIEQHHLTTPNPDQHALHSQLLTKRIRLQHPNILKLIYFAPDKASENLCSFSSTRQPYSTLVYTEYPGDCLSQYAKINPMPLKVGCPCIAFAQGVSYLQQYYGFFEVSPSAVFLGLESNEKEAHVKVWIHPDKAECQPQFSCSEKKMLETVVSVLTHIHQEGFCGSLTSNQLRMLRNSADFQEMKRDLWHFHRKQFFSEELSRHKRCLSSCHIDSREPQERKNGTNTLKIETNQRDILKNDKRGEFQFRHQSTPHSSTHHKNMDKPQKILEQLKTPHQERKVVEIKYKPTDLTLISTQHSLLNKHLPSHPQQTSIKFNYRSVGNPVKNNYIEKKQIIHQQHHNPPNISFENRPVRSITNPLPNKINYRPNVLFDHSYGTFTVTAQNSPFEPQLRQQYKIAPIPSTIKSESNDFTRNEMEIPIKEQNQLKDQKYHLPTTSRSPPHQKQNINTKPITEQIQDQKQARNSDSPHQSRAKRMKSNTGSSRTNKNQSFQLNKSKGEKYKKLQQYTKQIKQYQQNIRKWMTNSMGTRKKRAPNVKPPLKSDRPKQFKVVQSEYNDDDSKRNQFSKDDYRLNTQEEDNIQSGFPKFRKNTQISGGSDFDEMERRQSLLVAKLLKVHNQERQKNHNYDHDYEHQFQLERQRQLSQLQNERTIQMKKEKERQQKERLQKMEIQRDLQLQTQLINDQMQDSQNQEAMKEEYRSIRQKVKKKQKIFAQLKAEAIKILSDSQY